MTPEQVVALNASERTLSWTIGDADQSFYPIGFGAPAGGLDAMKQLTIEVPGDSPHGLVIVQHISTDDPERFRRFSPSRPSCRGHAG